MNYAIVVTERFGVRGFVVPREYPTENIAINKAMMHFRNGSLHKVVVVDSTMKIVFKQTRKCKCMNVQQELTADGVHFKCVECGILIDHEMWRKQLYRIEYPAVEQAVETSVENMDKAGTETA